MFIIDKIKQEVLTDNKKEEEILIKNYLDCYEYINKEKIEILKKIFLSLKENKIKSCDIVDNNKILDGYELVQKNKKINDEMNFEEVKLKINNMMKEINNIQDAYFLKNFLNLIDSIKFIESEEIITLNFLFNEIINGDEFQVVEEKNKYQILIKD